MAYVIAGIIGLAYGALTGCLKYLFLWRPLLLGKREMNSKNLGAAQVISLAVNILILLSVFLLRDQWPYHFEVTIICAAVALSITGRLTHLRDIGKFTNKNAASSPESSEHGDKIN